MKDEIRAEKAGKSFLLEAAVLTVANFAVKIISVVFKIPLTNMLGESIGVFNAAYSVYAMLFVLSTSGLPVAVSRLVSASNEKGRGREAKRITLLAVLIFGLLGLAMTLSIMAFAPFIADFTSHTESALAMRIIAPSLFFICVSSAVRGYFQGLHNMYPTAVSQFIEAFFKLSVGLSAAVYAHASGFDVSVQAACAISGVTVGSALGMVFVLLYGRLSKKNVVSEIDNTVEKDKKLVKLIVSVAFPVTLTAATLYFSQFLDTFLIVNCLTASGESVDNAQVLFSAYTGLSVPLYDLFPSSLILPLGASILPAISGTLALGKFRRAGKLARQAVKISVMISLLCGIFLIVTGKSCIALVYGAEDWSNPLQMADGSFLAPIDASAAALGILAVSMLFVSVVSICNSLMNAYGVPKLALWTSLLGTAVLAVSEIFLLKSPLGIYGAPLSFLVCYFAVMLMDWQLIKRRCRVDLSFIRDFAKPLLCGVVTFAVTFGIYKSAIALWQMFSDTPVYERSSSFAILLLTGVVMVITYFASLMAFRSIDESDVLLLPKGDFLAKKLLRLGWIAPASTRED